MTSDRLECRPSGWKTLGLLAATAALLACSAFCTTLPDPVARAAGWVGLPFFALGGVMVARQGFRRDPVVVIDADGLTDRRLGVGRIAWAEVTAARVASVHGTRLLCLWLADPEAVVGRLSRWKRVGQAANRRTGFGDLCVSFVGLTPGVDEATDAVFRRLVVGP